MGAFTTEELTDIANDAFGSPHVVERDGLTYKFGIEPEDYGPMKYVNDMDGLGRLAWPVRNRYTGRDERPPDFTGAARKFGPTQMHDAVWWEPYREGRKVYDSPEDVAFMRDLLDYGVIWLDLKVSRLCDCCDQLVEVARETLGGIESPLIGEGNWDYLAECFDDLIHEATHEGATT